MLSMYEPTDDVTKALMFMLHIQYPCIDVKTGCNNREFWLERAREAIEGLRNPYARSLLEATIREDTTENIPSDRFYKTSDKVGSHL